MKYKLVIAWVFALVLNFRETGGYKILGLFPYNGQSHIVIFKSIMKELALRGHTVHVLSHYPRDTPLANYTDFSVLGSIPLPNNQLQFGNFDIAKYDIFNMLSPVIQYSMIGEHEGVMRSEAVQKLMKSNEKYDLIITESFVVDMAMGFVHKFKAPFIFLTSSYVPCWTNSYMAIPQNPAFIPHFLSRVPPKMTFFERFSNTLEMLTLMAGWHGFFLPANQRLMNKYFEGDMPPLLDLMKNASLILSNTHPVLSGGRPSSPILVNVGGVHIEPPKKLPRDIEQFIEESPHGVIYFCMGSLLRAATFTGKQKNAFLHTFSKVKERVLWKFEDENVSISDNVMIKAWMPQRDILAHPKVKLFISHGGLLGALEAISEGKPIVGIPMFGDQATNVRTLQSKGVAKFLDYFSIDNETFYDAVREMLKPKYAETAKEMSKLFHDQPMSPMDTAVYWIEYVIRNNGALHLRSPAADLTYFQYLLLDVFLFFILCLIASLYFMYYFFKLLPFRKINYYSATTKLKGQ